MYWKGWGMYLKDYMKPVFGGKLIRGSLNTFSV